MKQIILSISIAGILLAGILWWVGSFWLYRGDVEISIHGIIALVVTGVGCLVVGGGLMSLVFHSSRSGHDDEVNHL